LSDLSRIKLLCGFSDVFNNNDEKWNKSYEILDHNGTQLLFALAMVKTCFGTHRFCAHAYSLQVKDPKGETVITMECASGCLGRKRVGPHIEILGIIKLSSNLNFGGISPCWVMGKTIEIPPKFKIENHLKPRLAFTWILMLVYVVGWEGST
jgi:hypothetical protein